MRSVAWLGIASLPLLFGPLLFGCAAPAPRPITLQPLDNRSEARTDLSQIVPAGRETRLDYWIALRPDCRPTADDAVVVTRPPLHGTATVRPARIHPDYPPDNPRSRCDAAPRRGLALFYAPFPNYRGPDEMAVSAVTPAGNTDTTRWHLSVR